MQVLHTALPAPNVPPFTSQNLHCVAILKRKPCTVFVAMHMWVEASPEVTLLVLSLGTRRVWNVTVFLPNQQEKL